MVIRLWIAVTAALAIVLATVAFLCTLQHSQLRSELVRQRLAVTVDAAIAPFQTMVDMGLSASMARNSVDLLMQAQAADPKIMEIQLFDPTGVVAASTRSSASDSVAEEILQMQRGSIDRRWSLELGEALVSGASIRNEAGTNVAGVVAYYPMSELAEPMRKVAEELALAATVLFVGLSALAFAVLTLWFRRVAGALGKLDVLAAGMPADRHAIRAEENFENGVLGQDFRHLAEGLEAAAEQYEAGLALLPDGPPVGAPAIATRRELVALPETPLARRCARGMTPIVAVLLVGATLMLGGLSYFGVAQSLTPEFDRRTTLIGSVARAAVVRSVDAGVPIDALVGVSAYVQRLLTDFPEISYIAIATDRPLVEVGDRTSSNIAPFAIDVADGETGYVLVGSDPNYLADQFGSIVLDLAVIVIVAVLFSFELVLLVVGGSMTGPLERVLYLVNLQASGDFTRRLGRRGRGLIDGLGAVLSSRADELNARFAAYTSAGQNANMRDLQLAGRLSRVLQFCSVRDVRLALFLFAAADQLPLSFFSLYARAVDNPFPWLDEGLAISLPLAAYLLAALFGAGAARPLAERFGHRGQFIAAAIATVLANVGFFLAGNLIEVIAFSVLNGMGFALASLACQDYVIDRLPKDERSRSVGLVSAALFGGVFAGTALGGVIADRLGERPVFLLAAAFVAASALLIVCLMPSGGRPASDKILAPRESFSLNLLAPLGSFRFVALTFGVVVPQIVADQVFVSYLLALALDDLGASIAEIARVMMVYFLVLIAAGHVAARLPPARAAPAAVAIASSVISGCSLLAPLLLPTANGYLLAAIGSGFGHGLSRGAVTDLVVRFAEGPLARLGASSVLGASRVLERAGSVVGLLVIGALTGGLGYSGATGAIAVVLIAGAVLFAISLIAPLDRTSRTTGATHEDVA